MLVVKDRVSFAAARDYDFVELADDWAIRELTIVVRAGEALRPYARVRWKVCGVRSSTCYREVDVPNVRQG